MYRLTICALFFLIASKGIGQNAELIKKLKEMNKQARQELNSLTQQIQSNPNLANTTETKEIVPNFSVSSGTSSPKSDYQGIKKYSNKDLFTNPPVKKPSNNVGKGNSRVFEDSYKNFVPIN